VADPVAGGPAPGPGWGGRRLNDLLASVEVEKLFQIALVSRFATSRSNAMPLSFHAASRSIAICSRHVQHMQKALEQMNLKLTEILSDITGATGRAIMKKKGASNLGPPSPSTPSPQPKAETLTDEKAAAAVGMSKDTYHHHASGPALGSWTRDATAASVGEGIRAIASASPPW